MFLCENWRQRMTSLFFRGDFMRRIFALLLALLLVFGISGAEDAATPTDLYEIEDWGEIEIEFERSVYLTVEKEPEYFGDEMRLLATLVDFQPDDQYTIYWQYSLDEVEWITLEDENWFTFTIIIDENNYNYWWRVVVKLEGVE